MTAEAAIVIGATVVGVIVLVWRFCSTSGQSYHDENNVPKHEHMR